MSSKVSAVIRVSKYKESCDYALRTILENPSYFSDVHIIENGYDKSKYASEEKELFEKHNLEVHWHNSFNPDNCLSNHGCLMLPPDAYTTEGDLKALIEDMPNAYTSCNFFGARTQLKIDAKDFFSTGFLLVLVCYDVLRSFWGWLGRYHRTSDIRLILFNSRGNRRFLPRELSWFPPVFFLDFRIAPSFFSGSSKQVIRENEGGFSLLARTLQNHRHLRIPRIRRFLLSFFLYAIFALPWWSVFFMFAKDSWFYRSLDFVWLIIYFVETIFALYVASTYFELRESPLFFPLIPLCFVFFLTASLIVFPLVRFFHTPKSQKKIQ